MTRPRTDYTTADPTDTQIPQKEWHRREMLRAAARIMATWPRVLDALDLADGYPPGRGYDTSPGGGSAIVVDGERVPATSVEVAALSRAVRVGWLAKLHDVVIAVCGAAWPDRHIAFVWTPASVAPTLDQAVEELAARWTRPSGVERILYDFADESAREWPDPAKVGDRVGAVTVGARTNDVETCCGCGLPVLGGRADRLRRVDGDPFHERNPEGKWCYHAALRSRGKLGGQRAEEDEAS